MNVSSTGISLALLLAAGNAYGHDCTVTWDANPAEEHVTRYTLYAAPIVAGGTEVYSVIEDGTTQTNCDAMGVAEDKSYWLTLTASNSYGESGRSPRVLLDLENAKVPSTPTITTVTIRVVQTSKTKIKVLPAKGPN